MNQTAKITNSAEAIEVQQPTPNHHKFAGKYSNLVEIGHGGTSRMFKAVDDAGQAVAIKVLSELNQEQA